MNQTEKITTDIVNKICGFRDSSPPTSPEYESFARKVWNSIDKYMTANKIQAVDLKEFAERVNSDISIEYKRNSKTADASIVSRKAVKYLGKEVRIQKIANRIMADKLPNGKSDNMTVDDIAKKHGVPVEKINEQLQKGLKIEMEHTNDKDIAKEISMDHLSEFADYYDGLISLEKKLEKK